MRAAESFPQPGTLTVDGAAGVIVEAWGASAQNDAEWAEIPLTSYAIRRGAHLRLRREGGFAANYRALKQSPPATVRLGNATLEVSVAGAGSHLVYVDGERFVARAGHAIIRGLDPGPHLLLAGERVARVVLRAGARRRIDLSGPSTHRYETDDRCGLVRHVLGGESAVHDHCRLGFPRADG